MVMVTATTLSRRRNSHYSLTLSQLSYAAATLSLPTLISDGEPSTAIDASTSLEVPTHFREGSYLLTESTPFMLEWLFMAPITSRPSNLIHNFFTFFEGVPSIRGVHNNQF